MLGTATSRRGSGSGRWYGLAAIGVAMLTVGLDATVLNVALPTLSVRLGASTAQLQWFASGYTLVLAGLLLPPGMLGDRYGRRRCLLAPPRLDAVGVVLSTGGLVGLTYGVITAGERHWTTTSALVPLAAGAALLAGFVTWERRCRYPLVDLGLFRSSRFAWSTSFVTLIGFSMFGLMFFGALANAGYRHGLGLSSLPAGLAGAVRGSVAGGVVVAEKLHDPQLQKQVCTAFVHAMDTTLLVTGGVAALAAVLALWFPRLAAIRQGPAAPASVEIPVPAGRR